MRQIILCSVYLCASIAFGWNGKNYHQPSNEALKKQLTPLQFSVTQESDTEKSFSNEYWNNHEDGIYVDVISGEPLFSSKDKFESGTGWPSFTKPLVKENIVEKKDRKLFTTRTEVRSKFANSHLGHVFDDGPAPTGLRYCLDSAALRFIPAAQLKEKGYEEFSSLFNGGEQKEATAVFAGGCFWCMQGPFDKLKGVLGTKAGYTGGHKENPTYEEVSDGGTGHRESVEVTYDPQKVSYADLLTTYWKNIDPYDEKGQFCDKGEQYTSAIFYNNESEKKQAEDSLKNLKPLAAQNSVFTKILPAMKFYPAEEYHQSYYKKNPIRYKYYRGRCGRDNRLKELWGTSGH